MEEVGVGGEVGGGGSGGGSCCSEREEREAGGGGATRRVTNVGRVRYSDCNLRRGSSEANWRHTRQLTLRDEVKAFSVRNRSPPLGYAALSLESRRLSRTRERRQGSTSITTQNLLSTKLTADI